MREDRKHKQLRYVYLSLLCLFGLLLSVSCSSSTTSMTEDTSPSELTIVLPGSTNTLLVNSQGKLLKDEQITSADGNITLSIDEGTSLLDENGKSLNSLIAVIDPVIPLPPRDADILGDIVEIQPQGALFNPSLKLTLKYDPSEFPQGINENDVWIYNYAKDTWEIVSYRKVDTGVNRVTTAITRFGKYAILVPTKPVETKAPVAQINPTSIQLKQALINGKPTLAEFGKGTCIPCKQMKPILEDLAVLYKDRLNVAIVSIDDYRELTSYYKVMAIPTQIGFDSNGKEVFRHVGFWPKEQIIPLLGKLGVK